MLKSEIYLLLLITLGMMIKRYFNNIRVSMTLILVQLKSHSISSCSVMVMSGCLSNSGYISQ